MNKKGFTFVEVIIALAIISILAAIIMPNFTDSTERVKLRSDVQAAILIQNAIELYTMEVGMLPSSIVSVESLMSTLRESGYIRHIPDNPQSTNASWYYEHTNNRIWLDITSSGEHIHNLVDSMTSQELEYIKRS